MGVNRAMNLSVFCAFATLSLTFGQAPATLYGDTNCGEANSPSDHIYRGVKALPNEFPWQVLIVVPDHLGPGKFEQFCGGTLLERNLVVTAAHCFDKQAKYVLIILGEHNRNHDDGNEKYEGVRVADSVKIHPDYDGGSEHDIALIFLSHHFSFSDSIHPICIPDVNIDFTGQYGVATGWGSTREHGGSSGVLKKLEVQLVSKMECVKKYDDPERIGPQHTGLLCGQGSKRGDTCSGDSGGPLAVRHNKTGPYMLVGVTKGGPQGGGCGGLPGLYTDFSQHLAWLRDSLPKVVLAGGQGLKNVTIRRAGGVECKLPPLPQPRHLHTLDLVGGSLMACGGRRTPRSCVRLEQGVWREVVTSTRRWGHTSWLTPKGQMLLVGGTGSNTTTELVWPREQAGLSFSLLHPTSSACSVTMRNTMLITGGWRTPDTVTSYSLEGEHTELPVLLEGRRSHACGQLGGRVLVVTGGLAADNRYLTSTELLTLDVDGLPEGGWKQLDTADLPGPRYAMASVILREELIVYGGKTRDRSKEVATVLSFNDIKGTWVESQTGLGQRLR